MKLLAILFSSLFLGIEVQAQEMILDATHFLIGEEEIPTDTSVDSVFYWNQNRRSLRVGVYEAGMLEEIVIGTGTVAFGRNNQVGGTFGTAFGSNNLCQGTSSFVWGRENKNFGTQGTVWGFSNEARNNYTTVFGSFNNARQNNATAWGISNIVDAVNATAWGESNTVTGTRATILGLGNTSVSPSSLTIGEYSRSFDMVTPALPVSQDFLFVVGNGSSGAVSNAMIVNRLGQVGIGTDAPMEDLHVDGNIYAAGTITQMSDVHSKYDFKLVDVESVLATIEALPISYWKYKGTADTHMGVMAQDFYEAFGLGNSEKAIATVDADGVAFAAIKALINENKQLSERMDLQEQIMNQMQLKLEKLNK